VAGSKVWDRQYKLRLHIGPLTLAQYRQFLPGQRSLIELRDWMRQLLGFEMLWDLRLILQGSAVPALGLSNAAPAALGLTSWLGRKTPHPDRGELLLNPAQMHAAASSTST
jgi:type VI secretion system protein ImpH